MKLNKYNIFYRIIPFLVPSDECSRKFSIPEPCRDSFEKMVEELRKMTPACQIWGYLNVDFSEHLFRLLKFRCIIGNEKNTIIIIIITIFN